MDREEDLIRERVEKDQEKLYKKAKKMQKTDKYVLRGVYGFIGTFIAIIFAIFLIVSLIAYYESKPELLDTILEEGTKKAQEEAKKNMKKIKEAMKLNYFG